MKHLSTWLTLALAAAVCAAAIFLPSHVMAWQDQQRWFCTVTSEDVSQADVSISYALTTAERIDLAAEFLGMESYPGDSTLNISRDAFPSENEISEDQILDACFEELRELSRLGVLPETDWDAAQLVAEYQMEHGTSDMELDYYRVMDWEDAQRKLSLWVISITFQPYRYASVVGDQMIEVAALTETLLPELVTCFLDAETGKCYFVHLAGGGDGRLSLEQLESLYDGLKPEAWADYLGLTEPELTEPGPEWSLYSSDSPEPTPVENPVKRELAFSQEEPEFTYYLAFHYTRFDAVYSEKNQREAGWFYLAYSPVWPA